MSNSSLVDYIKISPNRTSPRKSKIDTITIHCTAGQCSVEALGEMFAKESRKASSNYGIGSDGRIGMYVEEKDACWCSSNSANDNRAICIECSSDSTHPYAINQKVYDSLINLLVDICQRNGIPELRWRADKNLIGRVDQQNMTVHRWFANKACPGDYLYNMHYQIAADVNKRLKKSMTIEEAKAIVKEHFGFADSTIAYLADYYRFGNELITRLATAISTPSKTSQPNIIITDTIIDALAKDVIAGHYGNGQVRKDRLGDLYSRVQARVNQILK